MKKLVILLFIYPLFADLPPKIKTSFKLSENRFVTSNRGDSGPTSTFFNINRWSIQLEHQGFFIWNGTKHGSAGNYPSDLGNVIFAEGILWGVKVTDKYGVNSDGSILTDGTGSGLPRIRVNGSMYNSGLKSGKVLLDGNGKIKTSGYSENYRDQQIWRVRRDWNTADLTSDVAIIKSITDSTVTAAQIEATKAQYKHDWDEWPASEGAPYEDVNGDGTYTAAAWDGTKWIGDIPGVKDADQTVWTVANDLPDEFDQNGIPLSVSEGGWGSPPIGFEYQLTLWGYDLPDTNPLSSVIYKRAKLTYVGLPGGPADAKVDTMYFTQWIDPDLGTYTDDYVGSDTTLSLGYAYNGKAFDDLFTDTYNSPVPAVGYDFLKGPKVDTDGDGDLDTLGLSSFTYFAAGSSVSDPSTRVYAGTLQWFNLMEGFLPRPEYPTQLPFVDPITGLAEKLVLAGDPITGTGWVDGMILPPGDRRMVMSSGPFKMNLGDTQEIVTALVGGIGRNNLSSLNILKFNDRYAQYAYDNNFKLPTPPLKPEVSAFGGDKEIFLDWGNDYNLNNIENHSSLGVSFQGYEIWQLASIDGKPGWKIATYDQMNGTAVIAERVDYASGLILPVVLHQSEGKGVQFSMTIKDDYSNGQKLQNNKEYYYGIRAFGNSDNKIANLLAATGFMSKIAVTSRDGVSGVDYDQIVTNTNTDTLFNVNHLAGQSDGSISVRITNPAKLRGGTYIVSFEEDTVTGSLTKGTNLWSMADSVSGDVLISKKSISKPTGTDTLLYWGNDFGFQVRITGPADAFKNFLVTAHGGGTLDTALQGAPDWNGFPVTYTGRVNQSNGTGWFFHGGGASSGSYDTMISRIIRGSGWTYLIPNDFEYRFTYEDDNYAYLAYTSNSLIRVPFEIWNITKGYRLCPWSNDYDGNEAWGLTPNDHTGSGGSNDPHTDWIYPRLPANYETAGNATGDDETGYQSWLAASIAAGIASGGPATPDSTTGSYLTGSTGADYVGSYGPELMGRNVWFVWNLDDVSDGTIDGDTEGTPNKDLLPEKGTVVKIITNKAIQAEDKYSFTINGNIGYTIAKGDANADNAVDVSDVVILVDHIIELTVLTEGKKQYAADYNSDYYINIADGVGIVNKILGISGKLNENTRLKSVAPVISLDPVIAQVDDQFILNLGLKKGSFSGIEFNMSYPKNKGITSNAVRLDHNSNLVKEHFSKEDGTSNFVIMKLDGSTIGEGERVQLAFDFNNAKVADENISFKINDIILSSSTGETQQFTLQNSEAEFSVIPNEFQLYDNYPNPFNPSTTIRFDIASESFVTMKVIDILGREVVTLVNENKMPGKHQIRWSGKNNSYKQLPSGVYFVRLQAGSFTSFKKITLIK